MSANARNFRVGLFVFAGVLAIGSCTVVLGGGNLFATKVVFETYFDESVQGLEVGSAVKISGVQFGTVKAIGLVSDFYHFDNEDDRFHYGSRVLVRMEAVEGEGDVTTGLSFEQRKARLERQIEQGLRLRLTQSGITGVAFVEAENLDPERNPPMEILWEPEVLYVPSAPSTIAALTSSLERVMQRLEAAEIEDLVHHLDELAANLAKATEGLELASLQREAERLLAETRADLEAVDLPGLGDQLEATLGEAQATLVRGRRMMEGGRYDLEMALENMRVTSENLRDLTETLKEQPSLVLRGEPPRRVEIQVQQPPPQGQQP